MALGFKGAVFTWMRVKWQDRLHAESPGKQSGSLFSSPLPLSLSFLGNGGEKLLASAQSHSAERQNRASGKRQRHTIDEEGGGGGIWGWRTRRRGGWEIAWGVGGRLRCFCGAGGVAEERFPFFFSFSLPLSLSSATALKTTGLWGLQVTSTTSSTSSTSSSTTTSAEIHQLRSHRCLFRETDRAKTKPAADTLTVISVRIICGQRCSGPFL